MKCGAGRGSNTTGAGARNTRPTTQDKLEVMAHRMSDAELRATIQRILGNPKNAGARARHLSMGESLALLACMAEEARRVKSPPADEASDAD